MTEDNKDIVAASLKLDASKILPAFKEIDASAKMLKSTFETLKQEIDATEVSVGKMAKSMDKVALSADERKAKIMAESQSLIALRMAQKEYIEAKTQQLDAVNQIVDAKLKAQVAVQKKREDAIEQQEKEHQQRLATLQQKTMATSAQENLMQARIDREFQLMKAGDARLEMEAERHAAQMNRLSTGSTSNFRVDDTPSKLESMAATAQKAIVHATVFQAAYAALHETQQAFKEGVIELERNMAGYVQTNEHYFVSFNETTGQMKMNTAKLHEETTKFIHTAHDLGESINDVTESARLWGRMYKDTAIVQEMVRASTKLSTVDMVELEQSTKSMESTLAQYNVQVRNVYEAQIQANRVVDSWSSVAHNTMAPAKDLGDAFQRTGKIADEVGVSFDAMNGLISAGIRNTALSGANLGNMWKTVLGNIRTEKAVKEIEQLGVKTKEVVNGVEQWRKAEDILLELSTKVIDKNYDLTKSYEDISRGVYQYAKLAASLNVGDITLGMSASINSAGSTMKYLQVQMDTIQRKAAQTKASLMEVFNTAGDDGLRSTIKASLDILDQLLIGLTKVPTGVFESIAAIGALILIYRNVIQPLILWREAQQALTVAMQLSTVAATQETVAMTALAAGARNAAAMTAIATAGITLLIGAIATSLYMMGRSEKAQRDLLAVREKEIAASQQQTEQYNRQADFLPKLIKVHDDLQKQLESGTLTVQQQANVKDQLEKVSKSLAETIGEEGLKNLEAAGFKKEAVDIEVSKLNEKKKAQQETTLEIINQQKIETQNVIDQTKKRLTALQSEIEAQKEKASKETIGIGTYIGRFIGITSTKSEKDKLDEMQAEYDEKVAKLAESQKKLNDLQNQVNTIITEPFDPLGGKEGKDANRPDNQEDRTKKLQKKMDEFKHMVNMQAEGYTDAAGQLAKLRAIRAEFSNLDPSELFSLDEDIHRAEQGIAMKPNGIKAGEAFKFPLDDIDNQVKQAKSLIESATSLIDFYNARRDALGDSVDDSSQKIELYTNKQTKLAEANISLRATLESLNGKQDTLNELYNSGSISLEDYNKSTEDVTSRIASITKEVDQNSIAWWNQQKAIKDARQQFDREQYEFSEKWIAHQKATREMSAQEEYEAWVRVQQRQVEGSDLAKKADEEVYRAKKALLRDYEGDLNDFVQKEKKWINESKQAELQKIADEKDAFVKAQDEKIKAIEDAKEAYDRDTDDRIRSIQNEKDAFVRAQDIKIKAIDALLKAEQQSNDDQDYEKQLKAKKNRLNVLEAGVGPDAIKERKQLLQEIEKMQEDHNRDLRKRDLENQKSQLQDEKQATQDRLDDTRKQLEEEKRLKDQAWQDDKKRLEEEKKTKQAEFDQQKKDAETYYSNLLTAFDNFKNDAEGRAELLKSMQIMKESEKNQTILSNLDKFISDYQSKMSRLGSLRSQYDLDLEEYNNNKDRWEEAAARGDTAAMDRYNQRNDQLRNQYGVGEDTGKLQHFSEGGQVKGQLGQPVGVIAHAGELILNQNQQSNLFKLLNMTAPQVTMPTFDYSGPKQVNNYYYSFDNSIGSVAVNDGNGTAGLYDQRDGLIERQRALGMKVR